MSGTGAAGVRGSAPGYSSDGSDLRRRAGRDNGRADAGPLSHERFRLAARQPDRTGQDGSRAAT